MSRNKDKFQFVNNFPEFKFFFIKYKFGETDMYFIYEWRLGLGFFEIRKWAHRKPENYERRWGKKRGKKNERED